MLQSVTSSLEDRDAVLDLYLAVSSDLLQYYIQWQQHATVVFSFSIMKEGVPGAVLWGMCSLIIGRRVVCAELYPAKPIILE